MFLQKPSADKPNTGSTKDLLHLLNFTAAGFAMHLKGRLRCGAFSWLQTATWTMPLNPGPLSCETTDIDRFQVWGTQAQSEVKGILTVLYTEKQCNSVTVYWKKCKKVKRVIETGTVWQRSHMTYKSRCSSYAIPPVCWWCHSLKNGECLQFGQELWKNLSCLSWRLKLSTEFRPS